MLQDVLGQKVQEGARLPLTPCDTPGLGLIQGPPWTLRMPTKFRQTMGRVGPAHAQVLPQFLQTQDIHLFPQISLSLDVFFLSTTPEFSQTRQLQHPIFQPPFKYPPSNLTSRLLQKGSLLSTLSLRQGIRNSFVIVSKHWTQISEEETVI